MWIVWGEKLREILSYKDNLAEEVRQLHNEIAFLREQLDSERNERKELNHLILKRTGFIAPEFVATTPAPRPAGRPVTTWPKLRDKLEKQESVVTPEIERTEAYWKSKRESLEKSGELEKLINMQGVQENRNETSQNSPGNVNRTTQTESETQTA